MYTVTGKNGISVKVIADSIAVNGKRMTTFEMQLPKVLLAELNTHRVLSKNFQSLFHFSAMNQQTSYLIGI